MGHRYSCSKEGIRTACRSSQTGVLFPKNETSAVSQLQRLKYFVPVRALAREDTGGSIERVVDGVTQHLWNFRVNANHSHKHIITTQSVIIYLRFYWVHSLSYKNLSPGSFQHSCNCCCGLNTHLKDTEGLNGIHGRFKHHKLRPPKNWDAE